MNPYTEDKDYQAANEAFEKARLGEALALMLKVAKRYPEDSELKQQLGLWSFEYALQKIDSDSAVPEDWRTAIGYLEEALAAGGKEQIIQSLAVAHHNLGVYLNQQETYDEARNHFDRALALNPDSDEASVSLAINYSDQGDYETAEEILRSVIERSPGFLLARHTLGLMLSAQGKDPEAVEQFKRSQSPERNIVTVHYSLGVSYCNQGEMDAAEKAFRQALELDPEFVPALYNLGLVLKQKDDYPGAERCFEEVTRLDPDSPGGFFCLASLYETRDPAGAIPVWERFLELASRAPSEAEMVAKVTRHVAALKKRAETSDDE